MVWKAKAATPQPRTSCYDCKAPSHGMLICQDCASRTAPFHSLAEPEKPRVGGDRRRKGGPRGKD